MADSPESSDYDVVLLIEEALTATDAQQVRSLHESLPEPVTYHVLMPVEDAAAAVEAAMGSMSGHELVPGAAVAMPDVDFQSIVKESREYAEAQLEATLEALRGAGASATGELVGDPIEALAAKVAAVDGREAIILTRPHVVAEFFHVDWTSQARRKIGVPVLHLLERENFDEQAGGGEGVTGL